MVRENREFIPHLPDQFVEPINEAENRKVEKPKPARIAKVEAGSQGEVAESNVKTKELGDVEQAAREIANGLKVIKAKVEAGMDVDDLRGIIEDQRDELEEQIAELEDDVEQTVQLNALYSKREVALHQLKALENPDALRSQPLG